MNEFFRIKGPKFAADIVIRDDHVVAETLMDIARTYGVAHTTIGRL